LLEHVFAATTGRDQRDILQLSGELLHELALVCCLSPCAYSNLRATPASHIAAVDASSHKIAVCHATVSPELACELRRHVLRRGVWTRLLSPYRAWLRAKRALDAADELPDGERLQPAPLWVQLMQHLSFHTVAVAPVGAGQHVNVSEIRSIFREEDWAAVHSPESRLVTIGDSQVAGGCVVKGRSASPTLNAELQSSLASLLGGDLYDGHGWAPSHTNVADDPTRDVPLRAPVGPVPDWLSAAMRGEFDQLDEVLRLWQSDDAGSSLGPDLSALHLCAQGARSRSADRDPAEHLRPSARSYTVAQQPTGSAGMQCSAPPGPELRDRQLPTLAAALLATLPCGALRRRRRGYLGDVMPSVPGILVVANRGDSGARMLLSCGAPWILQVASQSDAAGLTLQDTRSVDIILDLVDAGAFTAVVAVPDLPSMSKTTAPPVRSQLRPAGLGGLPPGLFSKVLADNRAARAIAAVVRRARDRRLRFTVAFPKGSWVWSMRCWARLLRPCAARVDGDSTLPVTCCQVDLGCFGKRSQSPTIVLTSAMRPRLQDSRCSCRRPRGNPDCPAPGVAARVPPRFWARLCHGLLTPP